ncbi:MAG: glycosyltransferase [Gammaproteobacteria bacterium]|nr:glycosyltransferase [Gammaproteobacteria bacterium]
MNIVLLTNTFTPHVGGVARSVQAFAEEYRERGHRVLVVAPEFPDAPRGETDVVRIPAIQRFNASDFSVALPFPAGLKETLDDFRPHIIHSQHPFLLGMTALRIARHRRLPLVFTHHTLYEEYTHYVPGDSALLKRFVIELATHYANLSDQVFAPSESIRDLLLERGVTRPILVVPTGVRVERFAHSIGRAFRERAGIPGDAFVVGHLGRLAEEKNLAFLATAVAAFMTEHPRAHFLVVGVGPAAEAMGRTFARAEMADRLHMAGVLEGEDLADALAAMNVFAFASRSETQGMVLIEAMAAGLPVVALDAPGAREVVADGTNGRLIPHQDIAAFAAGLAWLAARDEEAAAALVQAARDTAEAYSMPRSAETALSCFEQLKREPAEHSAAEERGWEQVMARIKTEWDIVRSLTRAGDGALGEGRTDGER